MPKLSGYPVPRSLDFLVRLLGIPLIGILGTRHEAESDSLETGFMMALILRNIVEHESFNIAHVHTILRIVDMYTDEDGSFDERRAYQAYQALDIDDATVADGGSCYYMCSSDSGEEMSDCNEAVEELEEQLAPPGPSALTPNTGPTYPTPRRVTELV